MALSTDPDKNETQAEEGSSQTRLAFRRRLSDIKRQLQKASRIDSRLKSKFEDEPCLSESSSRCAAEVAVGSAILEFEAFPGSACQEVHVFSDATSEVKLRAKDGCMS